MIDKISFDKIKEKVRETRRGKNGHWLDPGEYEYIVREFFEEDVPTLIGMVETLLAELGPEKVEN